MKNYFQQMHTTIMMMMMMMMMMTMTIAATSKPRRHTVEMYASAVIEFTLTLTFDL